MTRRLFSLGALLLLLNSVAQSAVEERKTEKLLRLPGAMLLMGYPPGSLYLTTPDKTITLQSDKEHISFVRPSISADGSVVAAGVTANQTRRSGPIAVRTYSVSEKQWTDLHIVTDGGLSISPDGAQLAFQAEEKNANKVRMLGTQGSDWMDQPPARVHVLDIKTRKMTILMTPRGRSTLSWSPDGQRLAIDGVVEPSADEKSFKTVEPSIYVVQVATGTATKIAEGISPSWSPNGEWIAFFVEYVRPQTLWHAPRFRVKLVRPDGTDTRDLMDFGSWVMPNLAPVWSPDSKSLLLNISNNPDENTFNIQRVDVDTRKQTRLIKGTRELVFGWVAAN